MVNAIQDQADAAEREAGVIFRRISAMLGPDALLVQSAAVQALISRARFALVAGTVRLCPHTRLNAPRPLFANLDNPSALMCAQCFASSQFQRFVTIGGTRSDRTCDGCGAFDPDGVHPVTTLAGAVTFVGGLCDDCVCDAA